VGYHTRILLTEVFVSHANAPLTPEGRRRLAFLVVDQRWSLRRAAERLQCSPTTAKPWVDRYRAGQPLTDRSSRPASSAEPAAAEVGARSRVTSPTAADGASTAVALPRTARRVPSGTGLRDQGAAGSRGYGYLHHAVDDHSRVAYSEILDDERKETAAGFWARANAFFQGLGVTVTAVMTDNGVCYRSHAFRDAL